MRVLVTGATGFIGSWVTADLVARGHEVAVLVRPSSDLWRLAELKDRLRVITCPLDDSRGLAEALATLRPEAIAHLAWQGVDNTDRNRPIQARNVSDTVAFVDLAAAAGVRAFVGAGSQAEYGPYPRAIREDDVPRPTTLYGHAKLATGNMAGRIAEEHGLRFAWMRIFSAYGPKDSPRWIIPSLIRSLKSGERMALTACEQRWGFIHARDLASAFRIVIESEGASGIFNAGSPDAPPLRDTVLLLRDRVAPGAPLGFGEIPYRPDQVMVLQADVSRLVALGWAPSTPLADGLDEMIAYYGK